MMPEPVSHDYVSTLHFTRAMIGLCAQDPGDFGQTADFAYFNYSPRPE